MNLGLVAYCFSERPEFRKLLYLRPRLRRPDAPPLKGANLPVHRVFATNPALIFNESRAAGHDDWQRGPQKLFKCIMDVGESWRWAPQFNAILVCTSARLGRSR